MPPFLAIDGPVNRRGEIVIARENPQRNSQTLLLEDDLAVGFGDMVYLFSFPKVTLQFPVKSTSFKPQTADGNHLYYRHCINHSQDHTMSVFIFTVTTIAVLKSPSS